MIARLLQSDSRVRIFNRGDSSIGIDLFVGGLFHLREFEESDFVGNS